MTYKIQHKVGTGDHLKFETLTDLLGFQVPIHQQVWEAGKLVELYIDGLMMGNLPIQTIHIDHKLMSHLKIFMVHNFKIEQIDFVNFDQLTSLEILSLANLNLEKLPAGISKLINLKDLYLFGNRVQELPLKLLERINIIHSLPSIPSDRKLQFRNKTKDVVNAIKSTHLTDVYLRSKYHEIIKWNAYKLIDNFMMLVILVFISILLWYFAPYLLIILIFGILLIFWLYLEKPITDQYPNNYNESWIEKLNLNLAIKLHDNEEYKLFVENVNQNSVNIRTIPLIVEWAFSRVFYLEIAAIRLFSKLAAINQEVISSLNFLINYGLDEISKSYAKEIFEKSNEIPTMEGSYIPKLPTEASKELGEIISESERSNELEAGEENVLKILQEIITERRCCKLNGRMGDAYCSICGRSIDSPLTR